MQRRGKIVVGLHAGAFAGNRGHGDAVARPDRGAVEAVACHQHQAADAGRRRGAARLGHAGDGEPGRFRFAGAGFEHFDVRHFRIEEIEVRQPGRQQRLIG